MSTTRNPIQPRPQSLPGDKQKKLGPGTLRTAASIAGPTYQIPRINKAGQNADASTPSVGGSDIPTRTIDRESLIQDQRELYGRT